MLESVCWEMNGGVSLRLCKAHSGGIWRDLQGMAPWVLPGVGRAKGWAIHPGMFVFPSSKSQWEWQSSPGKR